MVIQRNKPLTSAEIASGIPPNMIHKMLGTIEILEPYSTSLPNGKKENLDNLKH